MAKVQNFTAVLLILCLFAILIPKTAFTDDSWVDVYGGAAQMRDGESTDIRMISETVRIYLEHNSYTVDASFEFFNDGKTATLNVGFPQLVHINDNESLHDFQTWVNGQRVEIREMPGMVLVGDTEYPADKLTDEQEAESRIANQVTKWLIKTVTFPANSKTITRVRYTAPYGAYAGPPSGRFVTYRFGTGRNWKGPIGKAEFIVKSLSAFIVGGDPANYSQEEERKWFQSVQLGTNERKHTLTDFEPYEGDEFVIWVGETKSSWEETFNGGFCSDWPFSVERVSNQMMGELSPHQLRIFRNAFYARHGKIFKSKDLNEFFKKYECYQPDPNFDESRLNEIEKAT